MDSVVLTYLDMKGFAEPIRLALAIGHVPFEDRRVSYEEVARLRNNKELPFGQVPVLQINGGAMHGQSSAILRWAGKKAGLYPPLAAGAALNDEDAQFAIDEALEAIADIHKCLIPAWYKHACARSPVSGGFYETTKLNDAQNEGVVIALNTELLPARFQQIDTMVRATTTDGPFVCGAAMTIADISLYVLITGLRDGTMCAGVSPAVVEQCPSLLKLVEQVALVPEVVQWEAKQCTR
jgi:glutathione S-transferase